MTDLRYVAALSATKLMPRCPLAACAASPWIAEMEGCISALGMQTLRAQISDRAFAASTETLCGSLVYRFAPPLTIGEATVDEIAATSGVPCGG